jgi:hypothetical protein
MTEPPYNTDIRSNTSSGLGGIFSQLAAIAGGLASLPGILTALQQVRDDLRLLVGTGANPGDFTSLRNELGLTREVQEYFVTWSQAVIGVTGSAGIVGSLSGNLATIRSSVTSLATAVTAIKSTIDAEATARATLGFNVGSLQAAIGSLGTDPPNLTVKQLLELIRAEAERQADCCEEGSNPIFDPDPPSVTCAGVGDAWIECSLSLRFAENPGNDVYGVVFPAGVSEGSIIGGINPVYNGSAFDPGLGITTGSPAAQSYQACIAWAFSEEAVLVDYDINGTVRGGSSPFNSYVSSTGSPPQVGSESLVFDIFTPPSTQRAMQANFAFANGTLVEGKVWVSWIPASPE